MRNVFGPRCRLKLGKDDGTTSRVQRHDLTIRVRHRLFTRKTNACSKTFESHMALPHYNLYHVHSTPRVFHSMEAGVEHQLRDMDWIVGVIDADAPNRERPGTSAGVEEPQEGLPSVRFHEP